MRDTRGKKALSFEMWGAPQLEETLRAAMSVRDRNDDLTHGFHTYPAGLHPLAARDLIGALGGASLYDPFCGGGTTLIEGMRAGMDVHGRDVSVVARLVSRARTALLTPEDLTRFRSRARKLADLGKEGAEFYPEGDQEPLVDWYAPHVLSELEAIRIGIMESDKDLRRLLWAVFSSILIKVSWRKSDTSQRREVHRRPPQTTSILFHKKARELARKLDALRTAVPADCPPPHVTKGDARVEPEIEPVDLIVTSPPYPGIYDYLPLQELRERWFGTWSQRRQEIGSRRSWREDPQKAYRVYGEDTARWVRESAKRLKKGGHLAVVVGDGLNRGAVVDAREPIEAAARYAGLKSYAGATVARRDHARSDIRAEHLLIFTK